MPKCHTKHKFSFLVSAVGQLTACGWLSGFSLLVFGLFISCSKALNYLILLHDAKRERWLLLHVACLIPSPRFRLKRKQILFILRWSLLRFAVRPGKCQLWHVVVLCVAAVCGVVFCCCYTLAASLAYA